MGEYTLRQLRDNLGNIVREVGHTGHEVFITDHGRAVAVIIAMDDYERLHEHADVADAAWLRQAGGPAAPTMTMAEMLDALGVSADQVQAAGVVVIRKVAHRREVYDR